MESILSPHRDEGDFRDDTSLRPQVYVEVNLEQAMALGVPVSDIYDALQSTMGTLYVNDFNMLGRSWQVNIQGEVRLHLNFWRHKKERSRDV